MLFPWYPSHCTTGLTMAAKEGIMRGLHVPDELTNGTCIINTFTPHKLGKFVRVIKTSGGPVTVFKTNPMLIVGVLTPGHIERALHGEDQPRFGRAPKLAWLNVTSPDSAELIDNPSKNFSRLSEKLLIKAWKDERFMGEFLPEFCEQEFGQLKLCSPNEVFKKLEYKEGEILVARNLFPTVCRGTVDVSLIFRPKEIAATFIGNFELLGTKFQDKPQFGWRDIWSIKDNEEFFNSISWQVHCYLGVEKFSRLNYSIQ